MKRIALFVVIWMGILSGCASSEDVSDGQRAEDQELQSMKSSLDDRDRTIVELKQEMEELNARLSETAVVDRGEETGCPPLAYSQEPVEDKAYEDFQRIEMPCYSIYIPNDWSYRIMGRELEFVDDRLIVGSTEVLDYFERGQLEHWSGNHTEQIGFEELPDAVPIREPELQTYRIRLIWTKPAAALEPDWQYDDTRYYFAVKPLERSFGFYFSTKDVSEETMNAVIRSFRLR